MTVLLVASIALTLVLTGLAVAVRAAAAVASKDRLDEMAEAGRAGAEMAVRHMDESGSAAVVAQVAVPIGTVTIGWLAATLLRDGTGSARPVASVAAGLIVAVLAALLCESVPRAAAAAAPERVLAALAWAFSALAVLSGPIVAVTSRLAAASLYPVGMWLAGERRHAHTADELAEIASEIDAADGGALGGGLFAGALGFLDVRVAEVMARRDRIVTVPHTSTVEEAERLVHRSGHSRVLVVGDRGEVTGFLHAKDLIGLAPAQRRGLLPAGLVRVALRVGPEDRVEEVLPRMRRARRHVAVVEEAGDVLGLVTLEDVLEAIVGDIRDESDQDHGPADPRDVSGPGAPT